METPKPRARALSVHYRLRLLDTAKQAETFHCFSTMGQQAAWLRQQALGVQMQASLTLVEGPDCFYCRSAKEA